MATGPSRHAQDGNALANLAGVSSSRQSVSALNYLASTTVQPYGNAFMDNDTLSADGTRRVNPFTSYRYIQARFLNDPYAGLNQFHRRSAAAVSQIGRPDLLVKLDWPEKSCSV
jgi:hypothetical protein